MASTRAWPRLRRRRLGREVFERLVQPLAAGIYTADPEKLSIAATMPRFLEMERVHGGLIRAARKTRSKENAPESGARYSLFVAPRDGMQALADAIVSRLPPGTVRTAARVEALARRTTGGWVLKVAGLNEPHAFDAVIVALPAPAANRLLHPLADRLADVLGSIPYASSAVLVAAYQESQFAEPLPGFGFVVPQVEQRPLLAASFTSMKFAHPRARGLANRAGLFRRLGTSRSGRGARS